MRPFTLPWLLLGAVASGGQLDQAHRQVVAVCNAYADNRPALVGEKLLPVKRAPASQKEPPQAPLRADAVMDSFAQRGAAVPPRWGGVSLASAEGYRNKSRIAREIPSAAKRFLGQRLRTHEGGVQRVGRRIASDMLWTRSLEYGSCEEYYVDLRTRRLVFTDPGGHSNCELELRPPPQAGQSQQHHPAEGQRFVAVLTRQLSSSPACAVLGREVPHPGSARAPDGEMTVDLGVPLGEVPTAPGEFVLFDAFTHSDVTAEEEADGLGVHSRSGAEAVVRLEDEIEASSITTETVSSRTLALDHAYGVEARRLHAVLEDLRGVHEFDRRDLEVEPRRTYIGVRLGVEGEPSFPQRLLLYPCEHMP